jgi:16S rRNA processing protein RimM
MKKSQYIHIGHCVSPHGIRGEFTFVFYNSESKIIKQNSEVFISPISSASSLKNNFIKYIVSKINYGNKIIVTLVGVEDRNTVEALIPFNIYCERENLPPLTKNEFYLHDLLGCKVLNFLNSDVVGVIVGFYENGEQLILEVQTENDKIDILFIEQFVPVVDIENKIIKVNLPEIIE